MWHDLWAAMCLLLIFEGMLPFLSPKQWRQTVLSLARLQDNQLRTMGLVSMLVGVGLLYLVH